MSRGRWECKRHNDDLIALGSFAGPRGPTIWDLLGGVGVYHIEGYGEPHGGVGGPSTFNGGRPSQSHGTFERRL